MKALRSLGLLALVSLWLASFAIAQAPSITEFTVKDTGCMYTVGVSSKQCSVAPGMTLNINGTNFGKLVGGVGLCDCPAATIVKWGPSRVTVIVNAVAPNSSLMLETGGGGLSNNVSYIALGPVITSIVVGNCTFVPNQSSRLCLITAGTQFTINGSYFGPATDGGYVITCTDCGSTATINSWDPNWLTNPSPYNNQIVATANLAVCGSTIGVFVDSIWSNYIPYTAC